MTEKERVGFTRDMEKFGKEISRSKELSRDFLVQAGIITVKGNLRKPYRHLCIALGRV